MTGPLISIVCPTYNHAEFLGEMIESVRSQTYSNWELVLVDDGSTDNTLEIAKEYGKLEKRIKIISSPHKGISATRNTAIFNSRGEYIAANDDDNFLAPDRLEVSLSELIKNKADIVYSDYYECDERGNITGYGKTKNISSKNVTLEKLFTNQIVPQVTIMAKRECYEKFPYREIDELDDEEYVIINWYKYGYKFHRINKPLVGFRFHGGNAYLIDWDLYQEKSKRLKREYI